ncbi:MAG: SHOCT domain-containing protein [Chloroflexi bacterium]|nr:SHOCT domain-containing protein [Chloroflexota bacterium]
MHGDWGFGFAGGWLMIVFWILIFGLVIGGLASLFNRNSAPPHYTVNNFDPHRIVQERYAKGEISREEYLALMNDFK